MHINILKSLLLLVALSASLGLSAHEYQVKNIEEYKALPELSPGDTVTLGNGVWKDAQLSFKGKGTAQHPIILRAQTNGKVTLEGASNLKLSGEYLIVSGLVFTNGYSPDNAVISFMEDKQHMAFHSRVTNCVIDGFNKPDRFMKDNWIAMHGRYNRLDHNYFSGKANVGPLLVVWLKDEASRNNHHSIDHNHFANRITTGSNGGETVRIGTSFTSLEPSRTIVRDNFFERCNGEVEVISNKSCENSFIGNVFWECQGSLVLRHGHNNLVEGNYFFGNNVPQTGGIRVINEGQTIINNHLQGIKGDRFRSALAVMNGVPNSPANRYMQVKRSNISFNTFIDCDHIQFGVGADEERSMAPDETTVANNLFLHQSEKHIFSQLSSVEGIDFSNNVIGTGVEMLTETGFSQEKIKVLEERKMLQPEKPVVLSAATTVYSCYRDIRGGIREGSEVGALSRNGRKISVTIPSKENTGPSWNYGLTSGLQPKEWLVGRTSELYDALKMSNEGDVIVLKPRTYRLSKSLIIDRDIMIRKQEGEQRPLLNIKADKGLLISKACELRLEGIDWEGNNSEGQLGISAEAINAPYILTIENCRFQQFDGAVLKGHKSSMASSLRVVNSTFRSMGGTAFLLHAETDDKGNYNAERLAFSNNLFENIKGAAIDLYRGGTDESTLGPVVDISHCTFNKVGNGQLPTLYLYGIQGLNLSHSLFDNGSTAEVRVTTGEPKGTVHHCRFQKAEDLVLDQPFVAEELILVNGQQQLDLEKESDLGYLPTFNVMQQDGAK
ncbi:polysaccharide lyase 6 family protein [Limibacter armeniacum]|uniref:polysaccharide lyase 6 family protein n=1 Tax=Limibacter armeniacum TaxID=466084 RepID=UPI002FE546B7